MYAYMVLEPHEHRRDVGRNQICLPCSQRRGLTLVKLVFRFFLFLKIDPLDLGTCHGTQRGTWTHKRFTWNNLDFPKLTEPGSLYWVHREEIDHPYLGICSRTQQ